MEYLSNNYLVLKKILKRFNINNAHSLITFMVVWSLHPKTDPFCPKENNEEILGPEVSYLNATSALSHLAQCTSPDLAFFMSLLVGFSLAPTH